MLSDAEMLEWNINQFVLRGVGLFVLRGVGLFVRKRVIAALIFFNPI